MRIINYVTCPKCKKILASTIRSELVCYKGKLKLFVSNTSTCVFCNLDYFNNKELGKLLFEIDVFKDEVDRADK